MYVKEEKFAYTRMQPSTCSARPLQCHSCCRRLCVALWMKRLYFDSRLYCRVLCACCQVFCSHVETLARRGKKQVVPEGLYDALIAVIDLLQKMVSIDVI